MDAKTGAGPNVAITALLISVLYVGQIRCQILRPGEGKIDVGYIAHPGFVEFEELNAITGPLSNRCRR